jgi:predicted transcriptional regulator
MNKILHILEDKKPHSVSELVSAANISEDKVSSFLQFLAAYQIIVTDEERKAAIVSLDYVTLR